ncbi:MAG: hypothetical protein ABSA21_08260 [Candidatus Limnocylindrales bacterium]|jgi:hypothetical protein
MTSMQNQAHVGPLNVLHDEGIPNILGGLVPPIPVRGIGLPLGFFVAALAILAVLGILVAYLA